MARLMTLGLAILGTVGLAAVPNTTLIGSTASEATYTIVTGGGLLLLAALARRVRVRAN